MPINEIYCILNTRTRFNSGKIKGFKHQLNSIEFQSNDLQLIFSLKASNTYSLSLNNCINSFPAFFHLRYIIFEYNVNCHRNTGISDFSQYWVIFHSGTRDYIRRPLLLFFFFCFIIIVCYTKCHAIVILDSPGNKRINKK